MGAMRRCAPRVGRDAQEAWSGMDLLKLHGASPLNLGQEVMSERTVKKAELGGVGERKARRERLAQNLRRQQD
jgi:hypothetical protein